MYSIYINQTVRNKRWECTQSWFLSVRLRGCECEYRDNNGEWYPVTIKYASDQLVVIYGITKILGVEQGTEIAKDIIIDKPQFRPLRTESERKHEAVLESICAVLEMVAQDYKREGEAKLIYEAIAAGKIPCVKLDD